MKSRLGNIAIAEARLHDGLEVACPHILLIEDSHAMSMLLTKRIVKETGAIVTECPNMAAAREHLTNQKFALALTGLNLPDAPKGEVLAMLDEHAVPTIIFTATFDPGARERYAQHRIIDYIVKDGPRTVDTVVRTINRILTNSAFTVLVVDDARAARTSLVEILTRQNFRVLEAHSGRQALDILSQHDTIELVITDHHMPDMDGYELTRRLRAMRNSEEMRIVGISSSTDRWLSASFLKAGASDFIYRPFVPEELQCRIDNNIETLVQLKHLRRLAELDHLTGLANRRHFFERMQRPDVAKTAGSVALLDIDHFKRINDTFGHDSGDRVLQMVGNLLGETCRPLRYLPARLGGEEFAIYLPEADAFQAHSFCESVRKAVEDLVVTGLGDDVRVTISIGVVEMQSGETASNRLHAADQLLYLAKAGGRNRVYSDLTIPEAMQKTAKRQ